MHRIFQEKFFVTEREKRWPTSPSSRSPAECREGAAWGNSLSLTKPKKKKKERKAIFHLCSSCEHQQKAKASHPPSAAPHLHWERFQLFCKSVFNYFEHWNVCWGSPDCFQLFLPQLTSFVKNWSLRTISWPLYKISFKPRYLAQTQKATWILRIELLHSFLCGFCLDLTSYLMVSWYFWICVLD